MAATLLSGPKMIRVKTVNTITWKTKMTTMNMRKTAIRSLPSLFFFASIVSPSSLLHVSLMPISCFIPFCDLLLFAYTFP